MFFKVTFLAWLALAPEVDQSVSIQLVSPQNASFRNWSIQLDDKDSLEFQSDGRIRLKIPSDSQSFEILDARGRTRYLGVWSMFPNQQSIIIEVPAPGIHLHQTVSASRIEQDVWEVPAEIGVIKPVDQPERAAAQTSEWLKEQAGVLLQKTNLGGGSPIIRGMSGNRILLMADGFRLNNATFRLGVNQYLNTLPADQLEQIEVLSGPSGVQYGSDGLGGTVHMRSADPASLGEPNLRYRGFLSTADGTHTQRVSGHGGKDRWFFQGHLKYNDYQDLDAPDPVGEQIPTGYSSWDGSANLTFKLDEQRRFRLINTHSDAEHVPRTDRVQSGRDLLWEYHPQKLSLHGLRYESRPKNGFLDFMDLGVGYLRQEEGTLRISSSSPNRLRATHTLVDTFQVNGTLTKITKKIQWVFGFDGQWDRVEDSAFNTSLPDLLVSAAVTKFPEDARYRTLGAFLVSDIHIQGRHYLKAGLRQTMAELQGSLDAPIGKVDERYNQLTPSLTWSVVGDTSFFSLGVSQGFRAPNLEDTLSLGPSNQGFDAPNPNLQPEKLWSYEINLRKELGGQLIQASLYTSRYEGLIEKVPGAFEGEHTFQGESVFILDNVGKAKVDGLSLRYQNQINGRNRLRADLSWVEGTQTDRNEPMSRIAPLRGNIHWNFRAQHFQLSGVFSWAERQDRLSPSDLADSRIPEDGTPGYGVVHLRGRYSINDKISVNLALENLGDKLYKTHGSGIFEPGRRALLELEAKWR